MARPNKVATADNSAIRRLRQYELAERLGRIGHWYWRVAQETIVWSPEVYRIFGVDPEEFEATIANKLHRFARDDRARVEAILQAAKARHSAFDFEALIDLKGGRQRCIRSMGECEVGDDGVLVGIFGVVQDITDRRTAEAALANARQRQADFAEMSSDWLWETGADHRFTYISPQIEATSGYPPSWFIGKRRTDTSADETVSLEMEMHLAWIEQHKPFRDFRTWRRRADGGAFYVSISGKPYFDQDGTFQGYRGSGRDCTEEEQARLELLQANRALKAANKERSDAMGSLKEANALLEDQAEQMLRVQEEVEHRALHDALTGIANRRYLDDKIAEMEKAIRPQDGWVALLHIDLDRFKQINDTAGHAAGDALLVHVAQALRETVRERDFVARIGGDEFVVLCSGAGDATVLSRIAERIIQKTSVPFNVDGRECWYGASIGVAVMRGGDIRPRELLVNADMALYRAKSRGRGCYEYFSADLQAEIVRSKTTADAIRAGLPRGEFVPYFQAQIDARTFQIAGFEALARWHHPTDGVLSPAAFLGIAEDLNVVSQIDRAMLEATLRHYRAWTDEHLPVPRLSINVSSRRLREPDLIAGLRELNLPRGVFSFELLESAFLDNADDQIVWNLDMLREMGLDVELDDFGSGHASIISLIKLRPDALKIDRELIGTITTDPSRRDLVRSIIDIGRSLNVRVVAEGVETLGQADLLRDLGCDTLQGYVFSKPMPAQAVPGFIQDWTAQPQQLTG